MAKEKRMDELLFVERSAAGLFGTAGGIHQVETITGLLLATGTQEMQQFVLAWEAGRQL